VKGVGNDIRKPGQDELAYDRIPLRAAAELGRFLRRVDADLPGVRQPLLVFSSVEDHVVHPRNAGRVMARAGSERKELVRLTGSYHVATLDYDAELLRERILGFALELSETPREARP
jgi:carboxylesterase